MVRNFIWKSGLKHGDMENRVDTLESRRVKEWVPAFARISNGPRNLLESLWDGQVVQKNLALTKACSPMVKFRAGDFLHWWGPDNRVGLRKLWI